MGIPAKINNAIFRVIILFLLIQFNVDNIYSQFSLAPNGVTIVCPGASSGDTGVLGMIGMVSSEEIHFLLEATSID